MLPEGATDSATSLKELETLDIVKCTKREKKSFPIYVLKYTLNVLLIRSHISEPHKALGQRSIVRRTEVD